MHNNGFSNNRNLRGTGPDPAAQSADAVDSSCYSCPRCNSDNTASLAIVFAQGKSRFAISGIALGSQEGAYFGTAVSESQLSSAAAPPVKRPTVAWMLCAVVSGLATGFLASLSASGDTAAVMLVPTLAVGCATLYAVVCARSSFNWNRKAWPDQYRDWSATLLCMRCGMLFKNPE